ncbi:hypothetical protein H5T89_06285, partial [bacterium]|nr:hypothetical protein [bacterium]
MVDITNGVILASKEVSGPESKAVTVLVEEVEKRTGIRLPVEYNFPKDGKPLIIVGTEQSLKELIKPYASLLDTLEEPGKEGY